MVHAKDIKHRVRCIQSSKGPSLHGLIAGKATHHPGAKHHAQPCSEKATCMCGGGQGSQKFTHLQGVIEGRTGNAPREAVLQRLSESPTHQGAEKNPCRHAEGCLQQVGHHEKGRVTKGMRLG